MLGSHAGRRLFAIFAIGFWLSGPLGAAEVTLRMKSGAFEIQGDLQSFDGRSFVIRSPELGLLEINATHYDCIGPGCPGDTGTGISALAAPAIASPAPIKPPPPKINSLGTATFIGGSAIGSQFMPELIASYAASKGLIVEKSVAADIRDIDFALSDADGNPQGRVSILRRGASIGLKSLQDNEADLVFASRRATDEEAAAFAQQGVDIRGTGSEHVFALDSLVVLVHKDNPLISLSADNIARIFAGEITDWSQLGQPAGPINVYAPSADMGTWTAFEDTILRPRGLNLTPSATRPSSAVEWSDAVAADPNGIGFNMLAFIRGAKPLNVQQSCGLISRPSVFSAKTEEFPLARRLYFYTKGRPTTPLSRELLDFALSPKAQEALKNARFVDQAPELLPFREQGGRIAFALNAKDQDFRLDMMRDLLAELSTAQRLSTTFRFAIASAFLDTKAEEDVLRLAAELSKPEYEDRQVMLIGFADSLGIFDVNMEVSIARARTVAESLGRAGFSRSVAKAFGELAPVSCNDTPEGRYLNRRVEVWVK